MNKKKLILYGGAFLGSFLVINVIMFFVLRMTSPKIGPRSDLAETAAADSLKTGDSLLAIANAIAEDTTVLAQADSTPSLDVPKVEAETPESMDVMLPAAEPAVAQTAPESSPEILTETELPAAPRREAEQAAQAVLAGDVKEMAKLAKLLEAMKPADAAAITTQLSTDQIIALMMKMKDRNAGKVLAELPVEQAARVASRMSQTALRAKVGS